MMAQDWYTPQTAIEGTGFSGGMQGDLSGQSAMFHLRPLSLGEILDRTFAVYRSHFALFAGMTAVYAAFALVLQLTNLFVKHQVIAHFGRKAGTASELTGTFLVALLILMPGAVTQAATVFAVSEVYLGKPTTAVQAFRATIGRWYRYIGIAFWVSWSLMWVSLLLWIPAALLILIPATRVDLAWLSGLLFFLGLCAFPYGIWAALRNALGVQATVIEGLSVRASMKRSKVVTLGAKWRIIVIGLIYTVLIFTIGALQMPLLVLVAKSPLEEHTVAQAISLIVNAMATTVVTPVGLIALSLVYFDQRVRQEALDLLMMLGPEPTPAPQPPAVQYAEPSLDPADPVGDDGRI
jgi:hypothetical protein